MMISVLWGLAVSKNPIEMLEKIRDTKNLSTENVNELGLAGWNDYFDPIIILLQTVKGNK